MPDTPLTVAWISDFPIEWLPDLPERLRSLTRSHPATWMSVLLGEFEKNRSLRLHIIALRKTVDEDVSFERNGVVFHVLKTPGGLRAPSLFWIDTVLVRRALKRIKPDLVHAWGTEKGAALVASRLGYPYLVTMQGLLTWYQELIPLNAYERFAAFLERISLRRARVVTTESTFAVQYLRQKYPHLLVRQAEHAPNWLFHQVQRRPQTNPIRFIAVGVLSYRKGGDLLFDALEKLLPDVSFQCVVVGEANRRLVEQWRSSLSPELRERLEFKGAMLPAAIATELASATIMVLPTRADTSPNVVKEAVVAGVPVVASRIGGIPDYVFHGENGFLFEPGNLAECVHCLKAACRHPLFGEGAVTPLSVAKARAYLSPEDMARRFFEAYQIARQ